MCLSVTSSLIYSCQAQWIEGHRCIQDNASHDHACTPSSYEYRDPLQNLRGSCSCKFWSLSRNSKACLQTKIDLSSTCLHDVSEYGRCKGPTPLSVLPGRAWPWALRKGAARGHAGRQKPFIQYEKAGHIHSFHGPPDSCEAPETSLSRVRN